MRRQSAATRLTRPITSKSPATNGAGSSNSFSSSPLPCRVGGGQPSEGGRRSVFRLAKIIRDQEEKENWLVHFRGLGFEAAVTDTGD
jgi:hypothetical protein